MGLEIDHVCKSFYSPGTGMIQVLNDVNLQVRPGQTHAVGLQRGTPGIFKCPQTEVSRRPASSLSLLAGNEEIDILPPFTLVQGEHLLDSLSCRRSDSS